jgi:hypothetical protein
MSPGRSVAWKGSDLMGGSLALWTELTVQVVAG